MEQQSGLLRRRENRSFFTEMNFTPFIDIMFVMMIIFMITAPFSSDQGVELELPQADTKAMNVIKEAPVIAIKKDKRVYLDKRRITLKDLEKKLRILAVNMPEAEVFLKADKAVPYGKVIEVMARIKKAGIEKVGMVTDLPADS